MRIVIMGKINLKKLISKGDIFSLMRASINPPPVKRE